MYSNTFVYISVYESPDRGNDETFPVPGLSEIASTSALFCIIGCFRFWFSVLQIFRFAVQANSGQPLTLIMSQ